MSVARNNTAFSLSGLHMSLTDKSDLVPFGLPCFCVTQSMMINYKCCCEGRLGCKFAFKMLGVLFKTISLHITPALTSITGN